MFIVVSINGGLHPPTPTDSLSSRLNIASSLAIHLRILSTIDKSTAGEATWLIAERQVRSGRVGNSPHLGRLLRGLLDQKKTNKDMFTEVFVRGHVGYCEAFAPS
jgi:hypothetical protein